MPDAYERTEARISDEKLLLLVLTFGVKSL
jgi:hypothetical protein